MENVNVEMSWDLVGTDNGGAKKDKKYLKLGQGTTKIRIIDAAPAVRWTHWIQEANNGRGSSVNCPGGNNECPLCADISAKKTLPKEQRSKYSSRKMHCLNVYNYETNQVELLDEGVKIFNSIKMLMVEMGDVRDYNIKIMKQGQGLGNVTYQVIPEFPPAPLTPEIQALVGNPDNLMDVQMHCKPNSIEQINQLMQGKSFKDIFTEQNNEASVPTEQVDQTDPGVTTQPYTPQF